MAHKTIKKIVDSQQKAALHATLEDFFENYYARRRQIYAMNFYRGIYFGFGSVLGGTVVVALLLWLLSVFQFVPFLDGIIQAAQHSLQKH